MNTDTAIEAIRVRLFLIAVIFPGDDDDRHADRKVEPPQPKAFSTKEPAENAIQTGDRYVVLRFGLDAGQLHYRASRQDRCEECPVRVCRTFDGVAGFFQSFDDLLACVADAV